MAQGIIYRCDCCGSRVESDEECPLVAYVVVGRVGGDGGIRVFEDELPPYLEALMQHPVWRRDYCVHCFGHKLQASPREVDALLDEAIQRHGLDPEAAERIRARAHRGQGSEHAEQSH